MHPGIKIGLPNGLEILKKSGAQFVEIYFRLDQQDQYQPIFQYLKKNQIQFGLHFWAVIQGKYCPNLVYYPQNIARDTQKLIQQTLDIAGRHGAVYVNCHPESFRPTELDLDKKEFRLPRLRPIKEKDGLQSLFERAAELQAHAHKRNTALYFETVPRLCPNHFKDGQTHAGRLNPVDQQGVPTAVLEKLGQQGHPLCFDIGHTVGQYPNRSRSALFRKTIADAEKLAPYTRLVHANTVSEPFNGTDSHDGLLAEDFRRGVFPNREQLIRILALYQKKPDVWVIPEPPASQMLENYSALKKIVKAAETYSRRAS